MPAPDRAAPPGDARQELALLEGAVRQAGAIALEFFGRPVKQWNKPGGSPVTEADLAVDRFLKEKLLAARPGYGWLSEETPDDPARLAVPRLFIVDPIDGTIAFLKHRPHFTICAALVEAGRPIAGAVFNPAADECFTAAAGAGAFLNGAPIHASSRTQIAGCRMLGQRAIFADGWPALQVENLGSIAYRVALVAAGRYDAMISLTAKRDWDLAAADIVLAEAGGRLTDGAGAALVYNRAAPIQGASIAAGPGLLGPLLTELAARRQIGP